MTSGMDGTNRSLKEILQDFRNNTTAFIRRYTEGTDVHELQERMLNAQLKMASLVGIVIYAAALIPAIQKHLYFIGILYTFLFFWLLVITFQKHLSYFFRTGSWLFFMFLFGVENLILSGFNVDAGFFFITFVILTSLLLGMKMAFLSLLLSSLAISIRALTVVNHVVYFKLGLPQTDPLLWIIAGLIFFVLGTISLYSISTLFSDLIQSLNERTKLAEDLSLAHANLSASEVRFRSLIEYSSDMVFIVQPDGVITYASPSVQRLWGYAPEELIGRNATDFIHPDDVEMVMKDLVPKYPPRATNGYLEVRIRHKDGSWRYFEYSGSVYLQNDAIQGSVVNCRDITERKNFENLLEQANENLELLVSQRTAELEGTNARMQELVFHNPAVIYQTSINWDKEPFHVTENISNLLGFTPEEVRLETGFWSDHIHPADQDWVVALKKKILMVKGVSCKYRMLHKNGSYRWIRDDMQLVLSKENTPLELVGSWIDVTSQIEAELANQVSEIRYRKLYETMMDSFSRTDMSGRYIEFNQPFCEMVGYQPEELYDLTYNDLTPAKWHDMEAEIVEQQIITRGFSEIYEKEYIRKDGTVFSVELRIGLTRDATGEPESLWAIVRDITERKKNEALLLSARADLEKRVDERTRELSESQERLRKLTREIITAQEEERRSVSRELHDEAGQVFVTLKHSLDIAIDEIPDDHQDVKNRLNSAQEMVDRSMQLMRSLSHRLRPPAMEVGGINISLEDLCQEIADQTNLEILYQGEDLPGLPNEIAISLYRVLQESLTNILKHASARQARVRLKYHMNRILLSVRDDGKGVISSSHEGTGLLGLEERLRLLGGDIIVESKPGRGVHLLAAIPWEKSEGSEL